MKSLLLSFLLLVIGATANAQSNFMDHIRRNHANTGRVVVNQDTEIDCVVNNTTPSEKKAEKSSTIEKGSASARQSGKQDNEARTSRDPETNNTEETTHTHVARQRYKAMGYRIQIFTGNNSHRDKQKAQDIGNKCQKMFPMLSVYTHFISPRWICRVGDFRSHEDAETYAKKIRASRISTEVRIVRCQVLLAQ